MYIPSMKFVLFWYRSKIKCNFIPTVFKDALFILIQDTTVISDYKCGSILLILLSKVLKPCVCLQGCLIIILVFIYNRSYRLSFYITPFDHLVSKDWNLMLWWKLYPSATVIFLTLGQNLSKTRPPYQFYQMMAIMNVLLPLSIKQISTVSWTSDFLNTVILVMIIVTFTTLSTH